MELLLMIMIIMVLLLFNDHNGTFADDDGDDEDEDEDQDDDDDDHHDHDHDHDHDHVNFTAGSRMERQVPHTLKRWHGGNLGHFKEKLSCWLILSCRNPLSQCLSKWLRHLLKIGSTTKLQTSKPTNQHFLYRGLGQRRIGGSFSLETRPGWGWNIGGRMSFPKKVGGKQGPKIKNTEQVPWHM